MNLSLKLPLSVGALLLLAVGAGLLGIQQLQASLARYTQITEVDQVRDRSLAHLELGFKTQVQEWKNTLLRGKDPQALDKYWHAFEKSEAGVAAEANQLQAGLPAGEARALVAKFAQAHATLGERYRSGLVAFKAADLDPAAGDAAVKGMERLSRELLEQVNAKIAAAAAEVVSSAHRDAQRALVLSLALMAAVLVAGGLGAVLLTRSILRPLQTAMTMARAVASGDLSLHVDDSARDETGQLLNALNAMVQSLAGLVGHVRASSDLIANVSVQIAGTNSDLSQRTDEQSASLRQTAAAMGQFTATVDQNAATALQANQLAQGASEAAAHGGRVVGQVVDTMQQMTTSSRKIVDIVGVIDGIAFQTNILALNAAVEAARAGEQGRGFAVVAAEVRSLAQRSAAAAKQIKTLIDESVSKVEAGARLVDDAGRSMDDIVCQVQRVTRLIGEIGAASATQTQDIGQVGDAVAQLDQMTRQNAALVAESATVAESLGLQAHHLAGAVGAFKLAGRVA